MSKVVVKGLTEFGKKVMKDPKKTMDIVTGVIGMATAVITFKAAVNKGKTKAEEVKLNVGEVQEQSN